MAAQLGNRGVVDGDAHIVNSGTPCARDFPRGRDQEVAELARPDEGDVALRGNRAFVMGVAGKGERRIRQQDMCGWTVIVSVASPGLIRRISIPRPLLASSSCHIASAQARARSSGESLALTFTVVSPRVSAAACRSGPDPRRSPQDFLPRRFSEFAVRACWNKPLELGDQSVSHDAKRPWCQRGRQASNRVRKPPRKREHP